MSGIASKFAINNKSQKRSKLSIAAKKDTWQTLDVSAHSNSSSRAPAIRQNQNPYQQQQVNWNFKNGHWQRKTQTPPVNWTSLSRSPSKMPKKHLRLRMTQKLSPSTLSRHVLLTLPLSPFITLLRKDPRWWSKQSRVSWPALQVWKILTSYKPSWKPAFCTSFNC